MNKASPDVAIYLPSMRGGGAERVMLTLANGLAARGIGVDLVLAHADGIYLSEVSPDVQVVDLGSRRVSASLFRLVRYLRQRRPRALLSALNHANVIAVAAHALSKVPLRIVVGEHTTVSRSFEQIQSWRQRFVLPLMRKLYRRADAVVAVSRGVADDLAETIGLPRERISVIYNPVVSPGLRLLAEKHLEHPWFGEGRPPVIIAVGRLSAEKDFQTLIRAFAKVRLVRDCRLIILGEGELRGALESLVIQLGVADDVQMPGFVRNPFAWMHQSSLFVLSSVMEGLPTVLIEAMACGVPVLSTDCVSGPYEILEGGKWGTLVPVGEVHAMADEILENLRNPMKADVASRASEFSVDAALDKYIKILFPG